MKCLHVYLIPVFLISWVDQFNNACALFFLPRSSHLNTSYRSCYREPISHNLRNILFMRDTNTEQQILRPHKELIYTSSQAIDSRRSWLSKTATAATTVWSIYTRAPKPAVASTALCDPSISVLKNYSTSRVIYLLGTAHISSNSALLAGQLVSEIRPDAVFVELDAKRVGRTTRTSNQVTSRASTKEAADGTTIVATQTPSSSTSLVMEPTSAPTSAPSSKMGVFNLRERAVEASSQIVGDAIKGLYKKLESEGFNAGEEFVVAVKAGQALGSKIILGDRDVDVTLKRLTEALAHTDLTKLFSESSELEQNMKKFLPQSIPNDASLTKDQLSEYVETLKAKENVKMIMDTLRAIAPELYNAMVAERDEFMSNGLNSLNQFQSIVAVMGIAHVDGVENRLMQQGWKKMNIPCQ